jgi:TfoX/Sxy family transcriptional regulator of competence genes
MARPKSKLDAYLEELLAEASLELPEVSTRFMFGSQAFFANAKIFALVWDGRIALKMSDPTRFAELLALPGSSTWSPVPQREQKPMSGWVLVTEEFHDDLDRLRPWVEAAHQQAFTVAAKPTRRRSQRKPAPRRAPPKKRPRR